MKHLLLSSISDFSNFFLTFLPQKVRTVRAKFCVLNCRINSVRKQSHTCWSSKSTEEDDNNFFFEHEGGLAGFPNPVRRHRDSGTTAGRRDALRPAVVSLRRAVRKPKRVDERAPETH